MTIKGKKYISLKDAAKLSGYSQDYLGQLIRKGKLSGKKVYVNVAWMTTEEDLRNYMGDIQNGNGRKNGNGKPADASTGGRLFASLHLVTRPIAYFAGGFLVATVAVLFYIFAVNIDSRLEASALESASEAVGHVQEMPEFDEPVGGYQSL